MRGLDLKNEGQYDGSNSENQNPFRYESTSKSVVDKNKTTLNHGQPQSISKKDASETNNQRDEEPPKVWRVR
jgi:hypothetical protein